jgi:AraC-like DNA-binding protein
VTRVAQPSVTTEVPRRQRQPVRPSLKQIVTEDTPEAIGQASRDYGYRLAEIAQHLGVHYATVSRRLKQVEQRNHN